MEALAFKDSDSALLAPFYLLVSQAPPPQF